MQRIVLFLLSLIFFTACSSAEPTLNPTEGARILAGMYMITIAAEDIQNFSSLDDLSVAQGEWILSFSEAGDIVATLDGQEIAQGNYTVEGERIAVYVSNVVDDDIGCLRQIGRYSWSLEANDLRMKKIAGVCDAMDLILTTHPLQRQP
jgi:hypothetical protein